MDIISTLHDDIITHILSFLPIKDTVQTTVLSRRWYGVWTRIRYLDFRGLISRTYIGDGKGGFTYDEAEGYAFLNLVFNVLSQNTSSSLSDLYIDVGVIGNRNITNLEYIYYFITSIGTRNFTNLDLCLPDWYSLSTGTPIRTFPQQFFNRNSLVRLSLSSVPLQINARVLLPHLSYISLHSVEFIDDDTLRNLLEGSLTLRKLNILRDRVDNARVLYIYSPVLQSLKYANIYSANAIFGFPVILKTPNLKKFSLQDNLSTDFSGPELPLLKKADICILLEPSHYRFLHILTMCKQAEEFFVLLFNPTIYPPPWPRDESVIRALPLFDNLTGLRLEVMDDTKWSVWLHFLYSSPLLEWFYIDKSPAVIVDWVEPAVPRCLSLSLERMTFEDFLGSQDEWLMIAYFLKEGRALTNLTIVSHDLDDSEAAEINEQLLRLPRPTTGFSHCFIEYIDD